VLAVGILATLTASVAQGWSNGPVVEFVLPVPFRGVIVALCQAQPPQAFTS
jgi:hypothetical protein